MYCHEFANIIEHVLSSPGLNQIVNFTVIPTPYPVFPNGTLQCHDYARSPPFNFDCDGAKFEACVVMTSPPSSQLRLARFFKCFEGPFANTDGPTDFSKRSSCVRAAGLPLHKIQKCYNSIANSTTVDNPVQLPFWKQSQAVIDYGFPYVEVNGVGPANWPDLLNLVCRSYSGQHKAAGCMTHELGLRVRLDWLGSGADPLSALNVTALEKSLTQALSLIAANITYPVNFYAGGNISDAYLLMNATLSTRATKLEVNREGQVQVNAVGTVYNAYHLSTQQGLHTKEFVQYFRLALNDFGLNNFAPAGVRALESNQVESVD